MCAAGAHLVGELLDAPGVEPFAAELLAGEEELCALTGTAGLDVRGLLAGLPAAGHDNGALDCRALLSVDVLGIGEAQVLQILPGDVHDAF